jgi:hypothetical protein
MNLVNGKELPHRRSRSPACLLKNLRSIEIQHKIGKMISTDTLWESLKEMNHWMQTSDGKGRKKITWNTRS